MSKTRPFSFKINAAEFFSAVQKIPMKERAAFVTQLSTDLITLEPVTDYGKQLIQETTDFIKKQSEYGRSGGKPKHRHPKGTLKAPLEKNIGSPYPKEEVKEEVKVKIETKDKNPLSEYSDDFARFWESYPDKTGKGKAYDSWKKQKPSLEKVLQALEWQTTSDQWTKEGGQYIPLPATYLNQRRWEDAPKEQKKGGISDDLKRKFFAGDGEPSGCV